MPAPTKLGNALARTQASVSRFSAAITQSRVLEPYTIRGLNLTCLMTIVGTERMLALEGVSLAAMERDGFKQDYLTQDKYELAKAAHILAEAIRDDDPTKRADPPPLGTREQWGALSPEIIGAVWMDYCALRVKYDPLGDDVRLTQAEHDGITDALKKKDGRALQSYGLPRLAAYLLITADRQSSSATPRFEGGGTSPESSSSPTRTEEAEHDS